MSGGKDFLCRSDPNFLTKFVGAKFKPKWLFKSVGERTAFSVAREISGEIRQPDFYVMAQVSLGELFKTDPENGPRWYVINAPRCDLAVCSPEGGLRLIIEVNGKGHDPYNDAIK